MVAHDRWDDSGYKEIKDWRILGNSVADQCSWQTPLSVFETARCMLDQFGLPESACHIDCFWFLNQWQSTWGSSAIEILCFLSIRILWFRLEIQQGLVEEGHLFMGKIQLNPTILNSVISNTPLSRTVSCSSKLKSTPAISNFSAFQRNIRQHQSGSAVKAPRDKMYWKLRNVLTCSQ